MRMLKSIVTALLFVAISAGLAIAKGEQLILPADLEIVEVGAFTGVDATHVVVPEGVTEIRELAFADSALSQIELPASVTFIAENAFAGLTDLTVYAPFRSYAIEYCAQNGIEYVLTGDVPKEPNGYAYRALSLRKNGKKQQDFYRLLQWDIEAFGYGDAESPEDLTIVEYADDIGLTSDEMAEAYVSLIADHPEYFWVSLETVDQFSRALVVKTTPECRTSAQRREIQQAINLKTEKLLQEIRNRLRDTDGSTLEIAAQTHDVLIVNVEYQLDAPLAHTIGGVLWGELAVCDGYAKAYKYLLGKQGVSSLLVTGDAGEPHAWNYVFLENGDFFTVDTTWDDTWFDTVSRTYFNLPDDVFALSHTPTSPSGTGVDYQYPLPVKEKPEIDYSDTSGVYTDSSVHISKDAKPLEIFTVLSKVCREAARQGKKAFSIHASPEEKEVILAALGSGWEINNRSISFFDLYVADDPDLAHLYAGQTGEVTYTDDVLCIYFKMYEDGYGMNTVSAYADGQFVGEYVSLAHAYAALGNRQMDTLELRVSAAHAYYMPERVPQPNAKRIRLIGNYSQVQLVTLQGFRLATNLELDTVWLNQLFPMVLDLNGYTLTLNHRASVGQFNMILSDMNNEDTGVAQNAFVKNGIIHCKGDDVKEFYCNVDVEKLIMEDAYTLSFRGSGVKVSIDHCIVRNPGEFMPCHLTVGVNEASDSVDLNIHSLTIEEDVLMGFSSGSGPQTICIGNVENKGSWNLGFHIAKIDSLIGATEEFEIPNITITGECNTSGGISLQYNTIKTAAEVKDMFERGIPLICAPNAAPDKWRATVTIYASYDAFENPNEYDFIGGEYYVIQDENGYLLLDEKITFMSEQLNYRKYTLLAGEAFQMTCTQQVVWTSSDETIATVDASGWVTAIKEGVVNIIATMSDGASAACCVTVEPIPVA